MVISSLLWRDVPGLCTEYSTQLVPAGHQPSDQASELGLWPLLYSPLLYISVQAMVAMWPIAMRVLM